MPIPNFLFSSTYFHFSLLTRYRRLGMIQSGCEYKARPLKDPDEELPTSPLASTTNRHAKTGGRSYNPLKARRSADKEL